jgi:hypothetical protein
MRTRSLALLILLILGSVLSAQPLRDRGDERGSFQRIVQLVKKVFGVTSNSDGLIPPRPDDPKP